MFEEHPNSYDSSGNGEIEAAVKHVTGVIARNKLDLERRVGMVIPVSYSVWMLTVRVINQDGLTAYEKIRKSASPSAWCASGRRCKCTCPQKAKNGKKDELWMRTQRLASFWGTAPSRTLM